MMLRLYLDEDSMGRSLVRGLAARGVDVVTSLEAGMIGRSDADHLEFALSQNRVLCSFNVRDFYRLHRDWLNMGRSHAGIILVAQQRYPASELLRRILRLAETKTADSMKDQVEFLSAWEAE